MKLDKETEEKLKAEAIKHLEKGKAGWDLPHTLACVYWMRKLIEKEGGNERILVTAMYLHDIGYPEMGVDRGYEDMLRGKKVHEKIGARESEKILRKIGFSEDEIKKIVYLVRYHDSFEKLDTHDKQLIVEADSLAAIDWERVTPTFSREDSIRYLKYFKTKRAKDFKTETGKKFLKDLLEKAEHYWD